MGNNKRVFRLLEDNYRKRSYWALLEGCYLELTGVYMEMIYISSWALYYGHLSNFLQRIWRGYLKCFEPFLRMILRTLWGYLTNDTSELVRRYLRSIFEFPWRYLRLIFVTFCNLCKFVI